MRLQYRIVDLIATIVGITLLALTSYINNPFIKPDYVFYYYHISIVIILTILFGPYVGTLTGGIGYPLVQTIQGVPIEWGFGLSCLVYAFLLGFLSIPYCKSDEQLKDHSKLYFIFSHILINLLVWVLIAPLMSILFYARFPNEVLSVSFKVFLINMFLSSMISFTLWKSRGLFSRFGIIFHNVTKVK